MRLIEDLQAVNPGRPDPTGKCLNVSPFGNANATRAWIAGVEMSRSQGRLFSFVVQYRDLGGFAVAALCWLWGGFGVSAYRLRISLRRLRATSSGTD